MLPGVRRRARDTPSSTATACRHCQPLRQFTRGAGRRADAQQRAASAAPKWFSRLPEVLVPSVDSMPDGGAETRRHVRTPETERIRRECSSTCLACWKQEAAVRRAAVISRRASRTHIKVHCNDLQTTHPLNRRLECRVRGGWAVYASNLAEEMDCIHPT